MFRSIAFLALAALAPAAALHAQTPPPRGDAAVLDIAQTRAPVAATYADAPTRAWAPRDQSSPTALDHRFTREGLAASVGFVCDNDGHIPSVHEAAPLAGSEPGRLLGTTLRVGF